MTLADRRVPVLAWDEPDGLIPRGPDCGLGAAGVMMTGPDCMPERQRRVLVMC